MWRNLLIFICWACVRAYLPSVLFVFSIMFVANDDEKKNQQNFKSKQTQSKQTFIESFQWLDICLNVNIITMNIQHSNLIRMFDVQYSDCISPVTVNILGSHTTNFTIRIHSIDSDICVMRHLWLRCLNSLEKWWLFNIQQGKHSKLEFFVWNSFQCDDLESVSGKNLKAIKVSWKNIRDQIHYTSSLDHECVLWVKIFQEK